MDKHASAIPTVVSRHHSFILPRRSRSKYDGRLTCNSDRSHADTARKVNMSSTLLVLRYNSDKPSAATSPTATIRALSHRPRIICRGAAMLPRALSGEVARAVIGNQHVSPSGANGGCNVRHNSQLSLAAHLGLLWCWLVRAVVIHIRGAPAMRNDGVSPIETTLRRRTR
jgi:hypothetical protein